MGKTSSKIFYSRYADKSYSDYKVLTPFSIRWMKDKVFVGQELANNVYKLKPEVMDIIFRNFDFGSERAKIECDKDYITPMIVYDEKIKPKFSLSLNNDSTNILITDGKGLYQNKVLDINIEGSADVDYNDYNLSITGAKSVKLELFSKKFKSIDIDASDVIISDSSFKVKNLKLYCQCLEIGNDNIEVGHLFLDTNMIMLRIDCDNQVKVDTIDLKQNFIPLISKKTLTLVNPTLGYKKKSDIMILSDDCKVLKKENKNGHTKKLCK